MMETKIFDCVEMKRRGAMAVYGEVKGMTAQQEIDYWQTATDGLKARQKAAQGKRRRLRKSV